MEEPGRLQSMGSRRVGHDWATSLYVSLSCIGEGNGNLLQCSCLENLRDGGAWWAAINGVSQSRTWLKRLSSSSSRGKLGIIIAKRNPNIPHAWLLSSVQLLVTPWTVAYQTLSMGFSRQEYWSEKPCPPPGDLLNPRIKHRSPILQADSLPSEPPEILNQYRKVKWKLGIFIIKTNPNILVDCKFERHVSP